jgi:hypothetical protein
VVVVERAVVRPVACQFNNLTNLVPFKYLAHFY